MGDSGRCGATYDDLLAVPESSTGVSLDSRRRPRSHSAFRVCFALLLGSALLAQSSNVWAEAPAGAEYTPPPSCECDGDYQVRLNAEAGALGVLYNRAQYGTDGTPLDLRKTAGEDNVLPYTRWGVELTLSGRHTLVLLYQPLATTGTYVPSSDVRVEGVTFLAGGPLTTTYQFPFYRASYVYRIVSGSHGELELGGTGQIRNARTTWEAADGSRYAMSQGVGFVPALKARGRYGFHNGWWLGFELDGIYAPISVFNGSDNDTKGAILDGSLRAGVRLPHQSELFLNVRYLGGGSTSGGDQGGNDYTKNWLHFLLVGVGANFDLLPR